MNKFKVFGLGMLFFAVSSMASLVNSYEFNGKGNWSLDAVGSNSDNPVGVLQAYVPTGSHVEKAFLYSSMYSTSGIQSVTLDNVTYTSSDFTALGANSFLEAYRADVTDQIRAKVGSGSSSVFDFTVNHENPNYDIDGEVLAIVFSNPSEQERTIAFLDGFSASGGDVTTFNFSSPMPDPSTPGFEALLSLGIGFGYQPSSQYSQVDVNGRRLTTSAGGQDDGYGANGALITVGGLGDNTANPADPYANGNSGPRYDDELYNLAAGNGVDAAPFLAKGISSFQINTLNPSQDDNIFFAGVNVTAQGAVNHDAPPASNVPEPGSLSLIVFSLIGLAFARRKIK